MAIRFFCYLTKINSYLLLIKYINTDDKNGYTVKPTLTIH